MTQGDTETRFMHLLQPIRDLTKNWEVDIASQLEDYLTEIEEIRISFDGGSTSMNFAEAALLIQGSACIYSKKVEYLYALVYQTLDLLASKKKLQQPSSVDEEGHDKDVSFAYQKNAEEFLSLDDIQIAKNIDLKEVDLNDNLVKVIPRTPLSLLKVNGLGEDVPLKDAKGEILGKMADFRLMTSVIHASGTLLLDMSHMSLLEASLMRHPMSTPMPGPQPGDKNANDLKGFPEVAKEPVVDNTDEPPFQQDANMSYDVDMADPPEESFTEPIKPGQNQMKARRELRPLRIQPKPLAPPTVDPWATLDPHEAKSLPEKPFKKGKPFKIPAALLGASRKKRKRKGSPEKPPTKDLTPISQFITKAYYSHASKFPNNALKRPLFPEFDNVYYTEFKRQQAARRKEKEILAKEGRFQELAEWEAEEDDFNHAPEEPLGGAESGLEDYGGAEMGDDGDDDNYNGRGGLDGMVDDVGAVNRSGGEIPSSQEIITSYEELVRKHVEAYMISAQQYTQVTELGRRVQAWEERINPILHREEKYGFFDIHEYGTIVLDKLEAVEHKEKTGKRAVPFSKLMEDRQAHDISRLFLATLQLANNYNVEIGGPGLEEDGMDTMTLKLLSKKRHNEELQEYRAPSLDK
ncbi:condensin-2 complex subunit H2-like isoform X2 [Acanthaster planci]|uniref:Condensin-2 complex subunit H2 n=1 Tax=Acanthaster planci TaxID=133434 RepID=A0A8B7Y9Q4_ACAPL|nr:condensin-2 complex subunit H2-like isoform X2 [Acanthaster planci]